MERKFYKTVVSYEILSEEPIGEVSLEDIAYECENGHWSGVFGDTVITELTGKEMAEAARKQGTDPEFFMLDDDGNTIDE
jgi:hypothetical protein